MSQTNPSPTLFASAPELSREEKADIIEQLMDDPDEVVCGEETRCRYCVFEVKDEPKYCAYFMDDYLSLLEFDSRWSTREEALLRLWEMATAAEEAIEQDLDEQSEAECDRLCAGGVELVAPFIFQDNTGFPEGFELANEEEVFRFFRQRGLLRQEEWGNLYSASLVDDEGTSCWVCQTRSGEMRLYKE